MRHLLIAGALAAAAAAPASAQVGVSISVGQPGFYGQIDIGDYPPPQLIYSQPRVIGAVPGNRPPIYLHVPPEHAKHWRRYCQRYNACNERVYFVQNTWYNRTYVPRYQERHRPPPPNYRPSPGPDRHGPGFNGPARPGGPGGPGPGSNNPPRPGGPGPGGPSGPDRHDDRR